MTSVPQTSPTCETHEFTNESTAFTHTSHPAVITHSHIRFNDNRCVHFSKSHLSISFLLVSEPVCEFYINYLNYLLRFVLNRACLCLDPDKPERLRLNSDLLVRSEMKFVLPFYRTDSALRCQMLIFSMLLAP